MKPNKIIRIINKAIDSNPEIGSIKDCLFIMPAGLSALNQTMPVVFIIITTMSLPFVLAFNVEKYIFDAILFIYIILLIVLFIILNFFSYSYLVFDIINKKFYTVTKLFNKLSIWYSNYIKTEKIKKIILKSDYVWIGGKSSNKTFCDSIIVLTQNNEEKPLSELYPIENHDILIERCKLLSECLYKDFQIIGEDELKKYIISSKENKGIDKIILILFFLMLLSILLYIVLLKL